MRYYTGNLNFTGNRIIYIPQKVSSAVKGVKNLPRVDVVYACADMSPDLIDLLVKAGAKGIVIAGVGNGNMTAATLEAAKKATDKGTIVVRSTRVPTGYVLRNAEVNDDRYNTIASDELNAPKSRVLLMLCLQQVKARMKFRIFFTSINGSINIICCQGRRTLDRGWPKIAQLAFIFGFHFTTNGFGGLR